MKTAWGILAAGLILSVCVDADAAPGYETRPRTPERRRADRPEQEDARRRESTRPRTRRGDGGFRIAVVSQDQGRWGGIRYHAVTGESWILSGRAWQPVEEPPGQRPERGNYMIKVVQTDTGRFGAVRMDAATGRAWDLEGGRWLPIAEP
jgi:hypothetical protein